MFLEYFKYFSYWKVTEVGCLSPYFENDAKMYIDVYKKTITTAITRNKKLKSFGRRWETFDTGRFRQSEWDGREGRERWCRNRNEWLPNRWDGGGCILPSNPDQYWVSAVPPEPMTLLYSHSEEVDLFSDPCSFQTLMPR